MNKVYKSVYNEQTGTWIAVSELAAARGKTKSVRALVSATGFLFSLALGLTYAPLSQATYLAGGGVDTSTGQGNIAVGADTVDCPATVAGTSTNVAIGCKASSNGVNNVAIGAAAITIGDSSLAYGADAKALNTSAIAMGRSSQASGVSTIAIGVGARADAVAGVSLGGGRE